MGLGRLIARQLGRPSRLTGRLMNLANAGGIPSTLTCASCMRPLWMFGTVEFIDAA
jgi:hypothetical protein